MTSGKKITTKEFIYRSNIIHQYKYDYSRSIYINGDTEVVIGCSNHGYFLQFGEAHLSGRGCIKCGEIKRAKLRTKTTKEFILECKKIHGNKYDYSITVYKNSQKSLDIICNLHGKFSITATKHIQGRGCKTCSKIEQSNLRRKTLEEFISQAVKIHGDRYDYSKFIYEKNDINGTIICSIHGDFEQTPASHIDKKSGCNKCGHEITATIRRNTIFDLILNGNLIHNNKYDYSKFIYKNNSTHSIIICPFHGNFFQTYTTHIDKKHGCPDCGFEKTAASCRRTIDEFIILSNNIHNNRYDYSKFIYINNSTTGIIICPIHGNFSRSPVSHIDNECGCQKCFPMSKGELIINKFLIKNNYEYNYQHPIKIKETDKRNKIVDFYLPSFNLVIEFNGKQHYEPVNFKGSMSDDAIEIAFTKQKERDNLLRKFCLNKNINLLEIDGRKTEYNKVSEMKQIIEQCLTNYIFRLKSKLYFIRNKVD